MTQPSPIQVPHPDDDPGWSVEEQRIANYLRYQGRTVSPGGETSTGRRGVARIAGLYGSTGTHDCMLDRIIVIDDDVYVEEEI